MAYDSAKAPKSTLIDILFALFLRIVSVSCLWFALNYWAMLIGYSFDGAGRFDLLPLPWRAAATTLAVVFPVAALGLWLLVSWGPVIWVVGAAVEIAMHEIYPAIFGPRPLIVALHVAAAVTFVLFQSAIAWRRWRKIHDVTLDSP